MNSQVRYRGRGIAARLANVASVAMLAHLVPYLLTDTDLYSLSQYSATTRHMLVSQNWSEVHYYQSGCNENSRTYCMGTYVQVCLIWLIYGVTMLTLEVRAGLLKGLYKSLLQLGQPLSPTRNALHSTRTMCVTGAEQQQYQPQSLATSAWKFQSCMCLKCCTGQIRHVGKGWQRLSMHLPTQASQVSSRSVWCHFKTCSQDLHHW
jgi:hypothetical protein